MIERFEALALQVWPAAERSSLEGWQLGFSDGCTKRANSVHTLGGSPGDPDARVDACERAYRDRGLSVIFKLTEASMPTGLDLLLEERGYRVVDPTSVQICEGPVVESASHVRLDAVRSEDWDRACMRLNAVAPVAQSALRGIQDRIAADCEAVVFGSIVEDGEIVAEGIAALQGGSACLCEIVTHEAQRRRGHARAMVSALCSWARGQGALPWLQVVAANAGARSLYQEFGFREIYQYWYRVSD